MHSILPYLQKDAGRHLEYLGWALILPLLPVSLTMDVVSFQPALLLIPIMCSLVLRFGAPAFWLVLIFAAPLALPLSLRSEYTFLDAAAFVGQPWIYLTAACAGWLVSKGPNWAAALPDRLTWKWALALIVLPVSGLLDPVFVIDVGQDTFRGGVRLSLVSFTYVLIAALGAGGVRAGPVLGLFAVLCGLGMAQDWLAPEGIYEEFAAGSELRIAYNLDSIGEFLSAAIVFAAARYLAAFDPSVYRSLPARRLPELWFRIGLVMVLTLFATQPGLTTALRSLVETHLWLDGGTPVFLVTGLLAGFLLKKRGTLIMLVALGYGVLVDYVMSDWVVLPLEEFVLTFALARLGHLWRCHARVGAIHVLPGVWLRLMLSCFALSALLILNDPAALIVVGPVVALGAVLLAYRLVHPGLTWPTWKVAVRGPVIDLVNVVLLISLLIGFWGGILSFLDTALTVPRAILTGQVVGDDMAGLMSPFYFIITVALAHNLILAIRSVARMVTGLDGKIRGILSRRGFTYGRGATDLADELGLTSASGGLPFFAVQARALGVTAIALPLAYGIALLASDHPPGLRVMTPQPDIIFITPEDVIILPGPESFESDPWVTDPPALEIDPEFLDPPVVEPVESPKG